MRQLNNRIMLTAPGHQTSAMGGTIDLDDVSCLHAAIQITGPITEQVVYELAATVRNLARSRGLWARS